MNLQLGYILVGLFFSTCGFVSANYSRKQGRTFKARQDFIIASIIVMSVVYIAFLWIST